MWSPAAAAASVAVVERLLRDGAHVAVIAHDPEAHET